MASDLHDIVRQFDSPELIDGGRHTAPSKRLLQLVEGKYKQDYNKPRMGQLVTAAAGIDLLRASCPHFDRWVARILTLTSTTTP